MSDEISLLPEDLRKKEAALKLNQPKLIQNPNDFKFSVPVQEADDIEVIEIDEGEIEQVLASEPLVARLMYKASNLFEEVKHKLFTPQEPEPAPKLPPQFFTPPPLKPKPALAPVRPTDAAPFAGIAGAQPVPALALTDAQIATATKAATGPGLTRAKLSPLPTSAARRVRVIKRVRKPVRVSFVSDTDLRMMQIDIPKRKFTLAVMAVVCVLMLGGGYYLLDGQRVAADQGFQEAQKQLSSVHTQIAERQKTWNAYQDLEPRLKALSGLLVTHVSPTMLLQDIENRTLPTVSYGSFSYTTDGRVQLSVVADSLITAAKQIVAFQKAPFIKKVEAQNYTLLYDPPTSNIPKSIQFQLILTIVPESIRTEAVAIKP